NPEWLQHLDTRFQLKSSGNSEIKAAWYELAIKAGYGDGVLAEARAFLIEVGRRKFLTPLYSALIENGMQKEASEIFAAAKENYHSVSYNTIQALLNKSDNTD